MPGMPMHVASTCLSSRIQLDAATTEYSQTCCSLELLFNHQTTQACVSVFLSVSVFVMRTNPAPLFCCNTCHPYACAALKGILAQHVITLNWLHQHLGPPSDGVVLSLLRNHCALGAEAADITVGPPDLCVASCACLKAKQPDVAHRASFNSRNSPNRGRCNTHLQFGSVLGALTL